MTLTSGWLASTSLPTTQSLILEENNEAFIRGLQLPPAPPHGINGFAADDIRNGG